MLIPGSGAIAGNIALPIHPAVTPSFSRIPEQRIMEPIEYARMHEAEERQWWYAGMRAISFSLLGPAPRGARPRILDAGCGTGNNLTHLAARGAACGVDLSTDAVRFCQSRGVTVARASLLALPFHDGAFDLVTSYDVIYHRWIPDDGAALREMARVLRPGGLLLLRVPALKLLWGAHDEAVHSRHRYTVGEVRRLFEAHGLDVVRATYCNTLLFPLLLVRRTLDRLLGRHGSDVGFLPAPLEWLFLRLLRLEARLVRFLPLPIGASVMALGRKRL
jgi:SAM-dependent methyltransferase